MSKDKLTLEMSAKIWALAVQARKQPPPRLGGQNVQSNALNELRPLLAQLVKNGEGK